MKKNYIAPHTEAMKILSDKILMASPGVATGFTIQYGESGTGIAPR